MISRIDLRGAGRGPQARRRYEQVLPRAALDIGAAVDLVTPVLADVRERGRAAVLEATARFDGVELVSTRVPQEALDAALAAMDPDVRAAVEEAAKSRVSRKNARRSPARISAPAVARSMTVAVA